MNRAIVRYILFLLAYIPIYIIAALKTIDSRIIKSTGNRMSNYEILLNNKIPVSLVLLSFFLVVYFKLYSRLSLWPRGNPIFTIKTVVPQHKEYITYLGTYILPFVSLETKTFFDMVAVAFMFLTIGFVFSKTNLIYTNPTLAFFGYDIYEIEDSLGNKYDCITKDALKPHDIMSGLKLGERTFLISIWKKSN